MNYLQRGCIVFIIPRYQKTGFVGIWRDGGNHLEDNSFIKYIRSRGPNKNT